MPNVMLFPMLKFCTFALVLSEVCLLCLMWMFSVVLRFLDFPICFLGIFRMILKCFELLLLLLVSLFFLHSTCVLFLLQGLCIIIIIVVVVVVVVPIATGLFFLVLLLLNQVIPTA